MLIYYNSVLCFTNWTSFGSLVVHCHVKAPQHLYNDLAHFSRFEGLWSSSYGDF